MKLPWFLISIRVELFYKPGNRPQSQTQAGVIYLGPPWRFIDERRGGYKHFPRIAAGKNQFMFFMAHNLKG